MSESSRPAWEKPGRFERAGVIGRPPERPTGGDGYSEVPNAPAVNARSLGPWPRGVLVPGAPGWQRSAVEFLLGACPVSYQDHEVLQRFPALAAHVALHSLQALAEGLRRGYREAPALAAEGVDERVVEALVRVYEYTGSRAAVLERDVRTVAAALGRARSNNSCGAATAGF